MAEFAKRGPGGARPGAGRKPKPTTRVISSLNELMREEVVPHMPRLLEGLKRLADGHRALDAAGHVYTTAPDFKANEYLINRLLGKPTERKELSGPEGGSISLAFERAAEFVSGEEEDPAGPGRPGDARE